MSTATVRKTLKSMEKEELEQALLAMYKNQPANKKEIFEIALQNSREGKPLPSRDAITPNLKKLEKDGHYVYRHVRGWYPLTRSESKKLHRIVKENLPVLLLCPPEVRDYEKVLIMLNDYYYLILDMANLQKFRLVNVLQAIKMDKAELFAAIMAKYLPLGYKQENLENMIRVACITAQLDPSSALARLSEFVALFKTGDLRMEVQEVTEGMLQKKVQLVQELGEEEAHAKETLPPVPAAILYSLLGEVLQEDPAQVWKRLASMTSEQLVQQAQELLHSQQADPNEAREEEQEDSWQDEWETDLDI